MTGEEERGVLEGELGFTGVCDVPLLLVPSQNVQSILHSHSCFMALDLLLEGKVQKRGWRKTEHPHRIRYLGITPVSLVTHLGYKCLHGHGQGSLPLWASESSVPCTLHKGQLSEQRHARSIKAGTASVCPPAQPPPPPRDLDGFKINGGFEDLFIPF